MKLLDPTINFRFPRVASDLVIGQMYVPLYRSVNNITHIIYTEVRRHTFDA